MTQCIGGPLKVFRIAERLILRGNKLRIASRVRESSQMMGLAGFLGAALIVYGFYRVFYRGGIWRKLACVAIGAFLLVLAGSNQLMYVAWFLALSATFFMAIHAYKDKPGWPGD